MSPSEEEVRPYVEVLNNLYENATYSAQAYFEAAKGSEFLGKLIVFIPALLSAIAGLLVALDYPKQWGVVSVAAGLMSATGSFLGAERKAPAYKESARKYTQLRQEIVTTKLLSGRSDSVTALGSSVDRLGERYLEIVGRDEPVPNRYYKRASNRIKSGVLGNVKSS